MDMLIIRLSDHHETYTAEWAWLVDGRVADTSANPLPLAALASTMPTTMAADYRTVLLLPGAWVLLTQVQVPQSQRRQLQQVLPFLLEEQLAEDVADLHIVTLGLADEPQGLPVAVMTRARMQQVLDACLQAGFPTIDNMLPDMLALPTHAGQWSMLLGADRTWLRTSTTQALTSELTMVEEQLQLLAHTNPTASILCTIAADADAPAATAQLASWQQRFPQWSWQVSTQHPTVLEAMSDAIAAAPATLDQCTLLQGEFAVRTKMVPRRTAFTTLLKIAACWFVLQLLFDGGQALYLSYRADAMRTHMVSMYRTLYPGQSKIIDPVRQMKAHIGGTSVHDTQSALGLLGTIATAWPAADGPGASVQSMQYRSEDTQWTMTVTAADLATLNALAQRLTAENLRAELTSVANDGSDITGQLAIRGDQP